MAVAAPLSAEDIASLEAAGLGHIGAKVRALLERQAHDRHEIEWRDAKIEKLTFELMSQSFSEQSNVWNMLRSSYLPSVLYRVGMIVLRDVKPVVQDQITLPATINVRSAS